MLALLGGIPAIIKMILGIGETVKSVSNDIARVRIAAREAETEEKKAELHTEEQSLLAKRDVLVAEAATGSRWNQGFRIVLSIPAAVILYKVIIWDRTFGFGFTHKLSTEEWTYIWMVCGFYLLNRTIQVAKR